jgi:hypothetical protein
MGTHKSEEEDIKWYKSFSLQKQMHLGQNLFQHKINS